MHWCLLFDIKTISRTSLWEKENEFFSVKNPFALTCLSHSYGPEVFHLFNFFFFWFSRASLHFRKYFFLIWQPKTTNQTNYPFISGHFESFYFFFTSHKNMIIRFISFWSSVAGCGLKKDFILWFWDRFYDHK